MAKNLPWTTVTVLAIVTAAIVTLIVTGHYSDGTVTIVVGLLPILGIGAGYAERNSRDIRNGTVAGKAKEGATAALHETGVLDVLAKVPGNAEMYSQALMALLQGNTQANNANTAAVDRNTAAHSAETTTPHEVITTEESA